MAWVRRFQAFLHPKDAMNATEEGVVRFLSYLAEESEIAATGQNQCFNALLFFFRHVLGKVEVDFVDAGLPSTVCDAATYRTALVSELSKERVGKVTDVIQVGDMVKVKLIGIDDRGKVKLSMRAVDQETGEEVSA